MYKYFLIIIICINNNVYTFFDPLSMIIGGFSAGAAIYYKLTYCERNECCDQKYIPARIYSKNGTTFE